MVVMLGAEDAFSTNGWRDNDYMRTARWACWIVAYKTQLPVLLETAIAGRLFFTAHLHLMIGGTSTRSLVIFSN